MVGVTATPPKYIHDTFVYTPPLRWHVYVGDPKVILVNLDFEHRDMNIRRYKWGVSS